MQTKPHVVILGGGFAGLTVARSLKGAQVKITLIDRSNHHLFQPLLYQVATAGLSPADIAAPIRSILRGQDNVEVLMANVTGVDLAKRQVHLENRSLAYDTLIIATGSYYNYFGHPEWEKFAPSVKSVVDATRIRRKILLAFESAEMETDPEKRKALLTFVLVGAGPTGVEMTGSIAELAHQALKSDFRHIDPRSTRILLVEAGPRILSSFPEKLSEKAAKKLTRLGAEIMCNARVQEVDADGVVISGERINAGTMIWCAGVVGSPAGQWLKAETDKIGRVKVDGNLNLPGHSNVYVIGDTACVMDRGKPLPGLAPVALQQGHYVATAIKNRFKAKPKNMPPFRYFDKGNLATVGRTYAVIDLGKIQLSGFIAWLAWVVVHIYYLVGFRNRLVVIMEWAWAYLTFQRGARLITLDSYHED